MKAERTNEKRLNKERGTVADLLYQVFVEEWLQPDQSAQPDLDLRF